MLIGPGRRTNSRGVNLTKIRSGSTLVVRGPDDSATHCTAISAPTNGRIRVALRSGTVLTIPVSSIIDRIRK